jgi:hypothetical protein
MASQAFAGVGTKFQRWNGASWDDIAEVNSIDGPGMTKDVLEVTSLETDAGYNEFITGFAEGGTLTLDMNFTRETYELMKEDFESDEVRSYRIQLPDYDSEPSTFTIEGLVIELPITMTADDKVTADVVIQITSEVILDVGSTVPAEESEIPAESSDEPPPASSEDIESVADVIQACDDGNTLLFFDHTLGVTLEDTDKVVLWEDQFNSAGMALEVLGSDGERPTKVTNGIQFDGSADRLDTGIFQEIAQPVTVYLVLKVDAFLNNSKVIQLNHAFTLDIRNGAVYSYRYALYGTSGIGVTDKWIPESPGYFVLIKAVLNGASSSLQLNNVVKGSGDIGTTPVRYITLGAGYTGTTLVNGVYAAFIMRNGAEADGSAVDQAIKTYYNDNYVHFPVSAVVEDATPTIVTIKWNKPIDTDTIGAPSDWYVGSRAVTNVAATSDGYGVDLTVHLEIPNDWVGVAGLNEEPSAGGVLMATGDQVPFCRIDVVNNVV